MLTREHAIAKIEGDLVLPDRLTRVGHANYPALAERMCSVYREGIGQSRKQLHSAIHEVMAKELDCSSRRIEAFCKLLDERSQYETDEYGQAAKLRRAVFRQAASCQPIVTEGSNLFGNSDRKVKEDIASSMSLTWIELRHRMFLDLIENHTLQRFHGFESPIELLSRYNVAQTQVALYDAMELNLVIEADFRTIIKYAKLARLMHRIARRTSTSYHVRLDGPSSVLQHTSRYGLAMAKFLPGLLSCKGWRMEAKIRKPKFRGLRLLLSPEDGLTSAVASPNQFDSAVEEKFAQQWSDADTKGWQLERETEILHQGQTVFFPDFVFRHGDGRKVMMEVVGFWTPEYLAHKRQVLRQFNGERIMLAVQESLLNEGKMREASGKPEATSTEAGPVLDQRLVTYKTAIPIGAVLERLEGWK